MSVSRAEELRRRLAQLKEEVTALQEYWASIFPEFSDLPVRQCQIWLKLYSFEQVVEGIDVTNLKFAKRQNTERGPMDFEQAIRYASGVMKALKLGIFNHQTEKIKPSKKETRPTAFDPECGCTDVNHCLEGNGECPNDFYKEEI